MVGNGVSEVYYVQCFAKLVAGQERAAGSNSASSICSILMLEASGGRHRVRSRAPSIGVIVAVRTHESIASSRACRKGQL